MGWELMQAPAPPGAQVLAAHPCATWARVMGRQTGPEMKTRRKRATACPQLLQPRLWPCAASGWLTLVPGKRSGSLSRLLAVPQTPKGPHNPVSSSGNRGTCQQPSHLLPVTQVLSVPSVRMWAPPRKPTPASLSVCLSAPLSSLFPFPCSSYFSLTGLSDETEISVLFFSSKQFWLSTVYI